MTEFLSLKIAFVTSIIFVKFYHDTPNSKGTRGLKPLFCTLGTGADNSFGLNFEHQRKLLLLWTFALGFRNTALDSDLTETFL